MSRSQLDDRTWMLNHLSPLMDVGGEINERDTNLPAKLPTYDKGYWTGLKLIALKYYVKPYLNILGPRKKLAYLDLLAGPGLNRIGDRQVPIPGSPLIPITLRESKYDFSRYLFVEQDPAYCSALKQRLQAYPEVASKTLVLCDDVNQVIGEVIGVLKEEDVEHALVFIDPEGLEFHWNSLDRLVRDVECDIIVNFPSAGVARCLGAPKTHTTLARFLGVQRAQVPSLTSETAIKVYRTGLASLGLSISMEIEISSGTGFRYHLIPAVRRTYSGSPWYEPIWQGFKERVEGTGAKFLDMIAQQIDGKQKSLD